MSALLELAERCEQATGPDRELDCLIHCELKGWQLTEFDGDKYAVRPDGSRVVMHIRQRPLSDITPRSYTVTTDSAAPEYTHLLDAPMALVPEGLDWVITKAGDQHYVILGTDLPEPLETWSGKATMLVLALCAAALRARAAA